MRREEVSSYSWYSLAQTLKAKNGNHHHWCSGEERKHGFWTRNVTGSPSWTGRTNLTFCRHPRKQTAADLPTHVQDSPQRRLEDPQAFPGQIRYIIPSTSSGSALVEPGKPPLTPEGAAHCCCLVLSITSQSSWSQARWRARTQS